MSETRTILVVDDEVKLAEVVASYLKNAGYGVLLAYTGVEALQHFNGDAPDLVVLDLMLPDIGGEDVCRLIRQKSDVPIVMLTARADEESLLKGLEIGADDYVVKPFSPRQLVARIAAVLRRSAERLPKEKTEWWFGGGRLRIRTDRCEVTLDGNPVSLTPNEFRILHVLSMHPNKVFTREELITLALGDDFDGSDRTIDVHVRNIRMKIEDDPKSPHWVLTAFGLGYRFGGGTG